MIGVASAWRIEGYAALFGAPDLEGDVICVGAFARSLSVRMPALLLDHDQRLVAGAWREAKEDSRGLFVSGVVTAEARAGRLAMRRLAEGRDGLSIGFTPLRAASLGGSGRSLREVTLWEVSIVDRPMAPRARILRAHPVPTHETSSRKGQDK